ncbi:transporter [Sphingomonas solaris]|uniref:Transporter n=1 Tax=Alterirhizorhabdus solaris TaxID=2529389 RepID=A0A558QX00_9SPHN|nr:transporter [Sphingomonas solaris]TVV71602.1 transporter [Sphingomonas solaris]
MRALFLLLPLALAATTAEAAPLRDLCSQRPGLGTPACTVDPGHLQIEAALGDWTLDRQPDTRTDTIVSGDVQARYGLTDTLEARIGWTAFGHERIRDRASGTVSRESGIGDVTVGMKRNLANPDGSGFSAALLPFASLPVGRSPAGAGDWGAGLLVPLTYQISDAFQIEFTPEIDAAVDQDRHGRHLAYSGVIGIAETFGQTLMASLEYQRLRDNDPSGRVTTQLAGVSMAWHPQERVQFDVGSNIGLDHASPDVQIYFGVTRKF